MFFTIPIAQKRLLRMPEEVSAKEGRVLIVGIGNPILSDDGVGIHVARRMKDMQLPNLDVEELPASGLELLDLVLGYDTVVVVDAIVTGKDRPGKMYVLQEDDFERTIHGASPHGINVATALAMGRRVVPGKMPRRILFVAIEADDVVNVCEELTPPVAAAVPLIIDHVLAMISQTDE